MVTGDDSGETPSLNVGGHDSHWADDLIADTKKVKSQTVESWPTLLIIDDDLRAGAFLAARFLQAGFACRTTRASDASRVLQQAAIDVALLEVSPEQARGQLHVITQVVAPWQGPLLLVSAAEPPAQWQDRWLVRPFLVETAVDVIERVRGARRPRLSLPPPSDMPSQQRKAKAARVEPVVAAPEPALQLAGPPPRPTPLPELDRPPSAPEPAPQLERLWAQAAANLSDDARQQAFIRACLEREQVSMAVRLYRELKERTDDPLVDRYLQQVGMILSFYALQTRGPQDSVPLPRAVKFGLAFFVFLAALLALFVFVAK